MRTGHLRAEVVNDFVNDFSITTEELRVLFRADIVSELTEGQSFQELPVRWHEILASRLNT